MITIRSQQMDAFEELSWKRFAEELAAHLETFEPALCQAAGPEGVRAAAELAIQRSRHYGLKKRGSIAFYAELMCVIGCDFDTDPQLSWANEVLADPSSQGEITRIDRLHEKMNAYLDKFSGPSNAFAIKALQRLNSSPLLTPGLPTLHDQPFQKWIGAIHPEKAANVGEDVLDQLLSASSKDAATYGLPSEDGALVLAGLKFALGHGICQDPLYPWVSSTLTDSKIVDDTSRLDRLVKKIRTYLQHVLTHLNG